MVFWKRGLPLLVLLFEQEQRTFATAFAPSALRHSIALFAEQNPNGDGGMDATTRAFLAYQAAPIAPSASNSNPEAPSADNTKLEQEMEAQYAEIEGITPSRFDDASMWKRDRQGSDARSITDEPERAAIDPQAEDTSTVAKDSRELKEQRKSLGDATEPGSNLSEPLAFPEQQFVDNSVASVDYSSRNDFDVDKDQRVGSLEYDGAPTRSERRSMPDDFGLAGNELDASQIAEQKRTAERDERDVEGQSMLMRSAEKLGLLQDSDEEEAKPSFIEKKSFGDDSSRSGIESSENTKGVDSSDPAQSLAVDQGPDAEIPITPPARTEAVVTKVTNLSSSDTNSVVATTRAKQRIKEDEEKPNLLLQILSDIVFSSDDSPKENQVRREKRTPVFDDLTKKWKSSIELSDIVVSSDDSPKENQEKSSIELSDIVFSSDDSPKENQILREKRTPVFDDLTKKWKSSIEEATKPAEPPLNEAADPLVAAPPETYYFNVNSQTGKWNPSEQDNVFRNESSQRPWTASLDSRGNFCVTYFDDDTVPVAPKRTGRSTDEWDQYENVSGRVYFVNRETGESQWEIPPGFDLIETSLDDTAEEQEEEPSPDSSDTSRVAVESKEEIVEKVDAKEEDTSSLTPIQRLLGKMSPAEKAELSDDVLNKLQPKQPDNALPSPIQRILGQMQGTDDKAFAPEQSTAPAKNTKRRAHQMDKGLTSMKEGQVEKGDEPEPQKKSKPKPFWSLNAKESVGEEEDDPPLDKPQASWPFWKK